MNDTIEITDPKAWVGCLGCYNSGSLNGAWVDGLEAGDISKAVKIKTGAPAIYGENCPVCIKCGSDEFWVFDHEGFNGLISGECSPSEAQEKAELLASVEEGEREAFTAWLSTGGSEDVEEFRDSYMDIKTNVLIDEVMSIRRMLHHNTLYINSAESIKFQEKLKEKINGINMILPNIKW
jgi:antirestriction protein